MIVVQEAFGITEHIQDVCDRLSAAGYRAVAPHLFHRSGDAVIAYDDMAAVMPHLGALSADGLESDIAATLEYLGAAGFSAPQTGIVGFCMGGSVVVLAAARHALGAAVTFYGGGIAEGRFGMPPLAELAPELKTPWLGLFGDEDQSIPSDQVEALREAAKKAAVPTEVVRYPEAPHTVSTAMPATRTTRHPRRTRGGAHSHGLTHTWRRADRRARRDVADPQVTDWTPPATTRSPTVAWSRRSSRPGSRSFGTKTCRKRVVEEAGRAFADFLGECLFVGATKPWGQSIAAFCAQEGGGQPEATIIATGVRTLASRAALANGTMALGFEYADFGAGSRPYPFAVTGPLAVAEAAHRPGRELALAIVIGYEVMGRVFHADLRTRQARSRSMSPRSTGRSRRQPAAPGCSACRRSTPTTRSGWRRLSPAARSKVTRRVPGSDRSTAGWPASAGSPRPSSRRRASGPPSSASKGSRASPGCTRTGISNRRCSSTGSATRSSSSTAG